MYDVTFDRNILYGASGGEIPGRMNALLLRPDNGAAYCDQPVCLCVCLSVCLWSCRAEFCVRIHCGRSSVLLRRRCATLCTSGFTDDVTFGRNGRDAGVAADTFSYE